MYSHITPPSVLLHPAARPARDTTPGGMDLRGGRSPNTRLAQGSLECLRPQLQSPSRFAPRMEHSRVAPLASDRWRAARACRDRGARDCALNASSRLAPASLCWDLSIFADRCAARWPLKAASSHATDPVEERAARPSRSRRGRRGPPDLERCVRCRNKNIRRGAPLRQLEVAVQGVTSVASAPPVCLSCNEAKQGQTRE